MRINTNVMSENASRINNSNGKKSSKSIEKLSSGLRINKSADDAAGLAISEKMRAQIRGLDMASKNCQDGISLVQTADGALQGSHDVLHRMREIAVQSASDTNETSIDRAALDVEYQTLLKEVDEMAQKVKFNDLPLFDGSLKGPPGLIIQKGANSGDTVEITIDEMTASALGLVPSEVASGNEAGAALTKIDGAINKISTQRADLGSKQNRLEFSVANLDISSENLSASESRIRDLDVAKGMTELTKNNILSQSSTAMLSQANAIPQGVLQILGG